MLTDEPSLGIGAVFSPHRSDMIRTDAIPQTISADRMIDPTHPQIRWIGASWAWLVAMAAFVVVLVGGCSGTGAPGPDVIDPDAMTEFKKTESGLQYKILRYGSDPRPLPTDRVKVDYRGWLENGRTFDSSYRSPDPASFKLNGVIPGWTEGLQLIGEGGMIELIIPAELAYGTSDRPGIPANSTLMFRVELIDVE